jgi:dTDP-4-dehydrorhamnose reductase
VARELAAATGRPGAEIEAIEMSAAGLRARRPKFAALSCAKLAAAGVPMPPWQDAIARYAKRALANC